MYSNLSPTTVKIKFFLACSLGLVTFLLAACGTTPPANTTTYTGSPIPATETRPITDGYIAQPGVVSQGKDASGGKIDFTEPPVLNDGVPVFIFFETEN